MSVFFNKYEAVLTELYGRFVHDLDLILSFTWGFSIGARKQEEEEEEKTGEDYCFSFSFFFSFPKSKWGFLINEKD